jgi:hypothetical protein
MMHGPLNVKLITLYTTCFYVNVSFILYTDYIYVLFKSQKKSFFLSRTLSGWFCNAAFVFDVTQNLSF